MAQKRTAGKDWYAQQLRSPKWQKKRLEILQRDNFRCVWCGSSEKELHVHHLKYNGKPWDVENVYLQTLCNECHSNESRNFNNEIVRLIEIIRESGTSTSHVRDLNDTLINAAAGMSVFIQAITDAFYGEILDELLDINHQILNGND